MTGPQHRKGKIVSGPHSTKIEGLSEFLKELEKWSEIETIRLGGIRTRGKVGRKSKKLKPVIKFRERTEEYERNETTIAAHSRPTSVGGFSFTAKRWARIGDITTGIHCEASYGRSIQVVVLTSKNLDVLKERLKKEGLGGNW